MCARRLAILCSRLQLLLCSSHKESVLSFFYPSPEGLAWTQLLLLRLWSYLLSQAEHLPYRHQPALFATLTPLMERGELGPSALLGAPSLLLEKYAHVLWQTVGYVVSKLNRKAAPGPIARRDSIRHARRMSSDQQIAISSSLRLFMCESDSCVVAGWTSTGSPMTTASRTTNLSSTSWKLSWAELTLALSSASTSLDHFWRPASLPLQHHEPSAEQKANNR